MHSLLFSSKSGVIHRQTSVQILETTVSLIILYIYIPSMQNGFVIHKVP